MTQKVLALLLVLLACGATFAPITPGNQASDGDHAVHDETDWNTDQTAFQTVGPLSEPQLNTLGFSDYPDFPVDPSFLKEKLAGLSGATPVTIDGKSVLIHERRSPEGRELARRLLAQE